MTTPAQEAKQEVAPTRFKRIIILTIGFLLATAFVGATTEFDRRKRFTATPIDWGPWRPIADFDVEKAYPTWKAWDSSAEDLPGVSCRAVAMETAQEGIVLWDIQVSGTPRAHIQAALTSCLRHYQKSKHLHPSN